MTVWQLKMNVPRRFVQDFWSHIKKSNEAHTTPTKKTRIVLVHGGDWATPYAVATFRCYESAGVRTAGIEALASLVERKGYASAAISHVQAFAAHCQCRYVYLDVPRSVIIDCDAVECFRQNPWEHDQCIKDQSDREDSIHSPERTKRIGGLLRLYHKLGFRYQMNKATKKFFNIHRFSSQYAYRLVMVLPDPSEQVDTQLSPWTSEEDLARNYDTL